jgi:O-antigen/teichoic acid export membrane protein
MLRTLIKLIKDKTGSNLGKDITVTLFSQLAVMALALAINKMLSVMLGVDGYGQYSIIKKSTSVLSFVMLSGMGIALPRYFSMYMAGNKPSRAKSTVFASLLVIAIVGILALLFSLLAINSLSPIMVGSIDKNLFVSALIFAFSTTLSSILFAYYRGANAFKQFAISQIAIQFLIAVSTLFFGYQLIVVINLWSLSTLLYVLISIVYEYKNNLLYRGNHLSWGLNILPELKILFRYGLPRLLGDLFLFSFAAVPLILINQKSGITASSYFATGLTLTAIITPLFSFLGMVLLPYVSTSIAQNNFSKADKLINQLTIVYLILAVISVLILWFGMDLFILLFFNSDFLPATGISQILTLSILFESVYLLLRNPIDAVSSFPNNAINLFVSLALLVVLFHFSATLNQYALSFLIATALKGAVSFVTWQVYRKKLKK